MGRNVFNSVAYTFLRSTCHLPAPFPFNVFSQMSRIHVKSDTQIHVIFLIFGDPEEACKPGEL